MALNVKEILIGPARVEFGGVDLGFTPREGVTIREEFEATEFQAAQTTGTHDVTRSNVRVVCAATFNQLTLEKYILFADLDTTVTGSSPRQIDGIYNTRMTQRPIVITEPGPAKSVRLRMGTACVITNGEKVFSNGEYTGKPVEFLFMEDPETGKHWTLLEFPASATTPTPASYQKITALGVASTLENADNDVPGDNAIQVTFNVDIRPDQLTSAKFMLKTTAGTALLPAAISYGVTDSARDYKKIVITPAAAMANSTAHQLIIADGVLSVSGAKGSGASITFTTTAGA